MASVYIEKRTRADGEVRYMAQVRVKRRRRVIYSESRTFAKKANAEKWARRLAVELDARHGLGDYRDHARTTVGGLIDRYLVEVRALRPMGRTKDSALRFLLGQPVARLAAIEVTDRDLVEHINSRRLAGVAASTAQQDIAWLRVLFKYARRVWGVPLDLEAIEHAAAYLKDAKLIARPRRRRRRPSAEELRRLEVYFSGRRSAYRMDLVLWLAIYSTRRQAELTRLRREDLDLEHQVALLRDVKHPDGAAGNDKQWHITDQAQAVLEHIMAEVPDVDGRLLPYNSKTVGAYFTQACKVLGIEGLRFHDLRHEGISRLAEDGATIPQLQAVSLHDSWSSLSLYVNMAAGRKPPRHDWEPPGG